MTPSSEGTSGMTAATVNPLRYDRSQEVEGLDPNESDAIICSLVPVGSRVLDIGCGTGVLMGLLKRSRQAICVGIEPNIERANAALSAGFNVHQGVVTPELLRDLGTFDVVLFADVLEHLYDPEEMLRSVKQAINPGGAVIASIPNVAHWTVRLSLLFGKFDYSAAGIMDATHIRWFTVKGVKLLFKAAGFKIDSIRHSSGSWMGEYQRFPFSISRRVTRHGLKLAKSAVPNLIGCQHIVRATIA